MGRFFNMDNKFFTFMSRVADLMLLNILFIVCCIPVVTIGASWTALYYVTLKMVRNEESYIIRSFFKSFKENFKQSTVIWLIMLAAGILLGLDFRITSAVSSGIIQAVRYGLMVVLTVYVFVMIYIFPLLSKFENSIKNTFKNSLFMSIRHLPYTFLIAIVTIVPAAATLLVPIVMMYGLIVWILAGFSVIAYINSKLFVKIFDNYIPEETEDPSVEEEPGAFRNLTTPSSKGEPKLKETK